VGETLYSSSYQPDPKSARDVLAFVLTPIAAFAQVDDPDEMEAVAELLGEAKNEAIQRWFTLRDESVRN
jgi:predicted alpha/beta hydrolase